ncbi:hypothetical protein ACS0TY_017138 [Phlomoides rotata]
MADNNQKRVLLFLTMFSSFLCSSFGYQFVVGGRDGWILNPSENYNNWAERNRFQVNDTLLFQYKKESNSVLVVNKDDYDKCNTGNPILKLEDGNSVFKFDRSGPFYFISGNKANCDQGQKLIIVVLAVRSPPQPRPPTVVSPPTAPSPNGSAGSPISPPSGAPTPATSPSSPSPSGGAPSPANSPLAPSPSGGSPTPANSPLAPSPASEAPGPATSPSSEAPGLSPTNSDAPSASITPGAPDSSTPGSGRPGDVNSPPPRSLAAQSGTPSFVLSSLVMSVVLGGFMV